MAKAFKSYKEGLLKDLADPKEAAAYLSAALEDGSRAGFLLALRDVAEANGMARVARAAKLNRENLYRMFSARGNPRLSSLRPCLDKMGLKLAVAVKKQVPA